MTRAAIQSRAGTALITGASSGIGYEFALLLARQGYDLILTARNRAALTTLAERCAEEFGVRADICVQDLSLASAVEDLVAEIERKNLDVDLLVNDAGFAVQGPLIENDPSALLDMLQVNVVALTHLTRLLLPRMVQRGRGKILNMASIGAFMPGPLLAAYFASKAYVLSFSEALANELQGSGVTITALCPGPTRTRFAHRARLIDTKAFRGDLIDPADVAREGFDAMMKGKRVLITGFKYRLQMLPTRLVPRRMLAWCARQYHETQRQVAVHEAEVHGWTAAPDASQATHVAQS